MPRRVDFFRVVGPRKGREKHARETKKPAHATGAGTPRAPAVYPRRRARDREREREPPESRSAGAKKIETDFSLFNCFWYAFVDKR